MRNREADFQKTVRWTAYTAGAIMIVLGALSVMRPLVVPSVYLGVGFLLAGLNNLVPYFSMKANPLRPAWLLPCGVLDVFFGLFFLSHQALAIFTLSTILGAWILLAAGMRAYAAFDLRKAGVAKWWFSLLNACVMLLAAVLLLSNPFAAAFAASLLAGCTLILLGALLIAEGRIAYASAPVGRRTR